MNLHWGMNKIEFQLEGSILSAEIYLLSDNDKIIVSDVDGTLTKNDIGGLINNTLGREYLHEGYATLLQKIHDNGYFIIWLTMRSLPFY